MNSHTMYNNFSCKWQNSIHEIEENQWKKLFGNRLLRSHKFFRIIEDSKFPDITYHYLSVYENSEIVSIIPCFTYHLNLTDILFDKFSQFSVTQIRKIFPHFGMFKMLVIGSYTSTCEHFVEIVRDLPEEKRQQVSEIINSQLELKRKETKCGLIFVKDVRTKHLNYIKSILSDKFFFFDSFPATLVPVGNDFLYPTALKKKHRKRYRNFKESFDASFTWEVLNDFDSLTHTLFNLYLSVLERSKNRFEVLNEEFFKNINIQYPDKSYLLIARDKQGEIRLIEIILDDEDRLIPLYVGIKYSTDDTKVLYMNAIFKTIQMAEEATGKKVVEFGQTSYYPKVMSGAFAEDMSHAFYSNNKIMSFVIKHFFKYVFKPIDVPQNVYLETRIEDIIKKLKENEFEIMNA